MGDDATMLNAAPTSRISKDRPTEGFGQKQNRVNVVDAAPGDDQASLWQRTWISKRVTRVDNGVLRVVERR
jgi:hypothetical protein